MEQYVVGKKNHRITSVTFLAKAYALSLMVMTYQEIPTKEHSTLKCSRIKVKERLRIAQTDWSLRTSHSSTICDRLSPFRKDIANK